jgi:leucyl-tRNA synthetase
LRLGRLEVRVRRQHPLAPYVVDFYCVARKLVIEVDGGYHRTSEQRARDEHRDAELVRLYGVRVLRIDAELVERDLARAIALVIEALRV